MNITEIERNQIVYKGELEQKFALLTDNDHLVDESENEERLRRIHIQLVKTEELYKYYIGL